jgi:hypothetical protein
MRAQSREGTTLSILTATRLLTKQRGAQPACIIISVSLAILTSPHTRGVVGRTESSTCDACRRIRTQRGGYSRVSTLYVVGVLMFPG